MKNSEQKSENHEKIILLKTNSYFKLEIFYPYTLYY